MYLNLGEKWDVLKESLGYVRYKTLSDDHEASQLVYRARVTPGTVRDFVAQMLSEHDAILRAAQADSLFVLGNASQDEIDEYYAKDRMKQLNLQREIRAQRERKSVATRLNKNL